MSAAKGPLTTAQLKFYLATSITELPDPAGASLIWSEVAGSGKIVDAGNLLDGEVLSAGPFEQTPNVLNYKVWGRDTMKSIPGSRTPSTLPLTIELRHDDDNVVALRNQKLGESVTFAIVADTGTTEKTAYVGAVKNAGVNFDWEAEPNTLTITWSVTDPDTNAWVDQA